MSSVELSDITQYFDSHPVLEGVSLDVRQGEFVSLLGPSGSGKTSLLRIISGLSRPSRGSVFLSSQDVTQMPAGQRGVGMVFQQYALFPHMTVEQNLSFGLRMARMAPKVVAAKTADMLKVVQLEKERQRYPSQLSGGQQQRVALARTLITEPRVLLMDEPFSSLDSGLRREMQYFVADLQQRLGLTTLLVTHDQQEAMVLSDRIALMFEGRVVQYDRPETLYEQPNSWAVATFMGATNIIPAQPVSDRRWESPLGPLQTRLPAPNGAKALALSIRPEHIRVVSDATLTPGAANCASGQWLSKHYQGAFSERALTSNGLELTLKTGPQAPFSQGESVRIQLPPDHLIPIALPG